MNNPSPKDKLKKIFGDNIFAFGGDPNETETPRVKPVPERKSAVKNEREDDDGDDIYDEVEFIGNDAQRQIAKLSRENARRRTKANDLRKEVSEKNEEIAELREELKKAEKLQKAYDKLQSESSSHMNAVRRLAIRSAIEKDKDAEGNSRSWYDVSMVEAMLDNDSIAVDINDLSVGGLDEQLAQLAEDKPFLVKSSKDSDGEDQQNTQQNNQPSGSAPQSSATGSEGQQKAHTENEFRDKFPALNL